MRATTGVSDLSLYKRKLRWQAEPGANGAGGRKTGRNGANLVLDVPVGTLALDQDGGLIADLEHPGAESIVARGGSGGRGNVHFKSSTKHAPDYAEQGIKGEEIAITLDLKLIAEVGLVGPPNAGKSSLLSSLTAAHPKVAAYPFTTLDPELGVAESKGGRIVIADIPGLIEGASRGAGLGLRFLRHVERTKILVYVIDGSATDPWADLATVRGEVAILLRESGVAGAAGIERTIPPEHLPRALSAAPDWRWLRNREDSPWYPTMRLFRQPAPGRWDDLFARVAVALAGRAALTARS